MKTYMEQKEAAALGNREMVKELQTRANRSRMMMNKAQSQMKVSLPSKKTLRVQAITNLHHKALASEHTSKRKP